MLKKNAKSNLILWETLDNLQATMGATDATYSDLLGLTLGRFRTLKRDKKDLPISSITELSKVLPTSLENIATGKVDYKAIDAHLLKGNLEYLPERYTKGALSKRRTSISLLYFVENMHGYNYVKNFLKNFHVSYSIFSQENENLSIFFLEDITSRLLKVGYKEKHFVDIGKTSAVTNKNGPLGEAFKSCGSVGEMFVRLAEEFIPILEDNFRYSIHQVTSTGCVVRAHFKNSTREALGAKVYGNVPICWTKVGLAAALPTYRGLPEARVKKVKCVYQGDPYCEMRVEFDAIKLKRLS